MISDQKSPIDTASRKKRGVPARKGNQILNHLMGVEIRYMDTDSYEDIYGEWIGSASILLRLVVRITYFRQRLPGPRL